MEKILVLGAGMVSRPMIQYLLDQPDIHVIMASRTVSKAEQMIDGHPHGEAFSLDVNDDKKVEDFVSKADVVVSLLPYTYHVKVAEMCIKHKKHMITTSYVSDAMRALDKKAKNAGILILNECGLDPGIDHMSAMRIIHDIEKNKGKVVSFRSTTGALPSHEANNNPFGYKFSWSPRGVLLASRNAARWLENGKEISIPGEQLFENYSLQDIKGVGTFENYPNRNSVPYKDIYGLKNATTVYRGTFRMTGWCETLRSIVALGWLNEELPTGFSGKTYGDLTRQLIGAKPKDNLPFTTALYLGLKPYSAIIKRLEWLGLFGDMLLPKDKNNPLDYLNTLTLQKMSMGEHERDMVVMHHEFIAEYPSKKEYVTSTLVDYGIPDGDTSVARTVALPAAIAVKMILKKEINMTGVHIPVIPEIYNPILDELEDMGIKFEEKTEILKN
ncbi:MAG: saccharopine dehydrogenase NADP-binding domain-containing protein [Thermoplasmata archaeon]|nr:saccharopine dehydrogenase NADP-binding domain-containing protein [Thermoplasmata archaeon]MBE3140467.1 saccharopine dehydrogenase NADP-binding domain-containing protein [Thermoplasmata archaeon]